MIQLSLRDREIMRLVAKGLANKQIALGLEPPCSEETVKGHLKAIYLKLGVKNRAEATAEWIRSGEGE